MFVGGKLEVLGENETSGKSDLGKCAMHKR